jgi:hypothetical protein
MSETNVPVIAIQEIALEITSLGRLRVLNTVADLAHFLLYEWPVYEPGEKHLAARKACIAALEGKLSAGACHIAFVEAATEDGVMHLDPYRPAHVPGIKTQRWGRRRAKR